VALLSDEGQYWMKHGRVSYVKLLYIMGLTAHSSTVTQLISAAV
jgi:hypothetical protein